MADQVQDEKQNLLQKSADTGSMTSSVGDTSKTDPRNAVVAVINADEEEVGFSCETFLPCDPRRWMHRFLMIFLMCALSFGSYYVYDNPAALQKTFINVMKIDNSQYTLLYSLYSWPNVILSIFGGFLLDRVFGIRIGTVVFSAFIVLGQVIFAVGAFINNFPTMLVGRFVFGDFMTVCQEALELNGQLISTDQLLLQDELRNKFSQMEDTLSPFLATILSHPTSPIHADTFPKSRQRAPSAVDPHRMSAILFQAISGNK